MRYLFLPGLFLATLLPAWGGLSTAVQLCSASYPSESPGEEPFDTCQRAFESLTFSGDAPPFGGTFNGDGWVSATPDTWKFELSYSVEDYARRNYIWNDFYGYDSVPTMAYAGVTLTDAITVTGGTGVYDLSFILSVDGTLETDNPLLSMQFCSQLYMPDGEGTVTSSCTSAGGTIPSTITLKYSDLPFDAPVNPTLSVFVSGILAPLNQDVVDALGDELVTGSAFGKFGSTVVLQSMAITDKAGNPISGISVSSASGYSYPVISAVPEPSTAVAAVAGLAAILYRRRRK